LWAGTYFAWPKRRRIILANASHVLGLPASDRRVRHLARRIYATYSRFVIELMRLPSMPADEPMRLVGVGGERGGESFIRLFERERAGGKGLIVVSAHIGSIDLLAGAFGLRGLPTYGVAEDSGYPELLQEMNAQRRRWNVGVIPWRNLRKIFSALREPAIVGLVVDWGYRADDVPVKLFGEWTTLPAGPAILAGRTKTLIVPVVNRRQEDGTYVASHYEPITVPDTDPLTVQRATGQIAAAIEDMIAAAPDQWYIFKPIWPATQAEKDALAARHAAVEAGAKE
jgi:KDO2-lipid IV(A) lauroyltransferase